MKRSRPYLLPLLALGLAAPAFAGDKDNLKCGVNQDNVWVYENLTSFDVGARLKCGESIEIVSRVKGYVKIRSASGAEGYVPDSTLPDLPPLPDPDDKTVAASGAAPSTAGETSLAAAARAARAAAGKSVPIASLAATPTTSIPSPAAAPAESPDRVPQQHVTDQHADQHVAEQLVPRQPAPMQSVNVTTAQLSAAPPAPVTAPVPASPVAAALPVPAAPSAPAQAPVPVHVQSLTAAPAVKVPPVAAPPSAPAPSATASTGTASAGGADSAPSVTMKQAPSKPAKHPKSAPAVTPSTMPSTGPSTAPARAPSAPVAIASLSAPASAPAMSAPASATSAPASTTLASAYPVRDIISPSRAAATKTVKIKTASQEVPIGAEYPDTEPQNESADPACHTFFSAYGLSPSQFKWLAANRQKLYPSICPAPNLASVDFVVLFTHDSDTYNAAMPTPVHTDHAGFSDFNPLTTIDTALLSGPDADRARREYVWVFRMRRGGFDPVKFSPRRRPQFSTESKGSAHAIEDAFNYLQGQDTRLEASQQPNQ